jgi:hypothetical protein
VQASSNLPAKAILPDGRRVVIATALSPTSGLASRAPCGGDPAATAE